MIAYLFALMLGAGGFQTSAAVPVQAAQDAPAATPDAKSTAVKAKQSDQAPKDPAKPKKAKKPKSDTLAPDEKVDADDPVPPVVEGTGVFSWKQHPSIRYKKFRLDFQAKLQEDSNQSYAGAEKIAGLDPWQLHRNRIGVQGTLFKRIEFEVERELTERELTEKDISAGITPKSQWKDVNVNLSYMNNAQIQVGKFKVPFSLDQMSGESHNDFVYRSAGANYLAPGRDIGVMVHGRFFKKSLNYWTGVFLHDGDNARSRKIEGGNETFATRLSVKPLRRANPALFDGFEIAADVALTRVSDDSFRPNGLRARTVLTQDDFASPVYVKGQRSRFGSDLGWELGSGSIRAEYMYVTDERRNQGFTDDDLPKARYQAWYVQGTWLLTGETKTRPVKPAGVLGAVELAGRYERIWYDSINGTDEAFSHPRAENILLTGEHALTLGVNWSVNRFVKLQFNAIREHVDDPDRNPVPNGAAFWSRIIRLQLVL